MNVETPTWRSRENCLELAAWGGSVSVLAAYIGDFAILAEFLMNTIGSAAIFCICIKKKAYQPLLLNGAWIVGSFYKYFFSK
jgi:hypothetical protein